MCVLLLPWFYYDFVNVFLVVWIYDVYYYFVCVDTKNSVGLVGCIEEVAHNAIAVYWNPLDSSAKVIQFYENIQ